MIRWKYVMPRLTVVAALMMLLVFAVDPVLRWLMISTGEATIGAKVEVEAVSTSLAHTEMAVQNLAIANPYSPNTNAVSAEYIWVDLEGAPLTRNRIIVREAVISGLKINATRDSSGLLEPGEEVDGDSQFGEAGKQWLEDAAKALGQGLEDDLESVRLAKELRERWPQEYAFLEKRIDLWLAQVKALEDLPDQVKELKGDVLAQTETVRRAALTLRSLKEELAALRAEFQRLHQQARLDRTDLAEAARNDVENIKERLELARLEPATLTDYFLGPQLGPQTRETVKWVQWARKQVPSSDLPQPERQRGTDILFAENRAEPWLLLRSMRADGEIYWRNEPIPFAAMANDWTVQPTVHGKPATLRLKTTVPAESWIELTVDRTGLHPQDRLTFTCPKMPMPAQTLGDAEYMALELPAGTVNVQAALVTSGDQIAGTIQVYRRDVPLELALGDKLRDSQLSYRLQDRLREINDLNVRVHLNGHIASPQTEFESPLGDQIRVALRGALEDEFVAQRERLQLKARKEIDEEIQALQDELALGKAKVMQKLNLADEQQQALEQLVASSFNMPRGQLGRKLLQALQR